MSKGLYIHVPFCLSKCPYCDFYSEKFSKTSAESYKDAVIRNLRDCNDSFDTIYFGGGTPILLSDKLSEITSIVHKNNKCEITVEANPCCATEVALSALVTAGINRISFGVQSFSKHELSQLGRRHSNEQAINAINLAHRYGIENISVDIMLGTPLQTKESVRETIDMISSLPVKHVSAYMLKIEENTPFGKNPPHLPDEDETCEIYLSAVEQLEAIGLKQYEISNFAVPGYESRHNLKYWRCEEYLGIGPSAHSYYNGKRFYVERNLNDFINAEKQQVVIDEENPNSFDEFAMLRLRLTEGLLFSDCKKFGVSRETIIKRASLIPQNLAKISNDSISLTPEGFLISNAIIGKILGY